jgi:hypothetical protein
MVQAYTLLLKATVILHVSMSWVSIHKANNHTLSKGAEENHEKHQNSRSLVQDFNH